MPESVSPPFGPDLRVRVMWLAVFRTVATTLLLVVLVVQLLSSSRELVTRDWAGFAVVATAYLLTLVTGLLLRLGRVGRLAAWSQVIFDLVFATTLVALSGGFDSPFSVAYLLAIIGAAALLGRRGAVVSAVVAVSSVAVLTVVNIGQRPLSRLVLEASIQILAQLLMAVLAAYLAGQLLETGGQLDVRERQLRVLSSLQNRIVAAMPSGLVTCDESTRITFANPAALAMLGVEEDPRGRPLDELLPGVSKVKGNRRAELSLTTAHGPRTLGLSVTPLEAGGGALLVVFQDLTRLRRLEFELERIDRLAALGRVSAQLAHEVRNPLASIRGSAQLIQSDAVEGSPVRRLSELIVREADRLAELVQDYLRLARSPPPAPTRVRLDQVVSETVEMLRADPELQGVGIEQHLEPVEAEIDVSQMKQVLINLLRNAVSATEARGPVRVTVKAGGGAAPLIEVWDGAGSITPEQKGRLFEPFFTTREEGTGLGLTTVQSIVHAHGGSIDVTSAPQVGTTFAVKLPAVAPGS